ncbi:MAG: hypothetical protein K2W96_06605, partial [Gemmataceae bacterium]|nr:hypothetical protein [Gemmataceae bacterium]
LCGTPWLNASGWRYAGSVGPREVPPAVLALGQRIARAGVRGLFGIDGILNERGFHPLEINPRYTASVEVLEYSSGLSALAHHAASFGYGKTPPVPAHHRVVGKAILYAADDLVFPVEGPWTGAKGDPPPFADIPEARTPVSAGQPVLTLLAAGADEEAVLGELRRLAGDVEQALGGKRHDAERTRRAGGGADEGITGSLDDDGRRRYRP